VIHIPFNQQPVSTVTKTAGYTIPAGNYARVTVNAAASATGYITETGSGNLLVTAQGLNFHTQDSDSSTATFWVPTGTVLGFITQTASATASGSNTLAQLRISGTSYVNFTIDTVTALSVNVAATCYCRNNTADGSNYNSATVTGTVSSSYTVELFNEIS